MPPSPVELGGATFEPVPAAPVSSAPLHRVSPAARQLVPGPPPPIPAGLTAGCHACRTLPDGRSSPEVSGAAWDLERPSPPLSPARSASASPLNEHLLPNDIVPFRTVTANQRAAIFDFRFVMADWGRAGRGPNRRKRSRGFAGGSVLVIPSALPLAATFLTPTRPAGKLPNV